MVTSLDVKKMYRELKDLAGYIPQYREYFSAQKALAPFLELMMVPLQIVIDGFQSGLFGSIENINENMDDETIKNLKKTGENIGRIVGDIIACASDKGVSELADDIATLTTALADFVDQLL